jgi:putative transposase
MELLRLVGDEGLVSVLTEPSKPWQNGINESFNGKFSNYAFPCNG